MSIQKYIDFLLRNFEEEDDLITLSDMLGGIRIDAYTKTDQMIKALLNVHRLQGIYTTACRNIFVWQTYPLKRPLKVKARKLSDTEIITERLDRHQLSGQREPVADNTDQCKFFLDYGHALSWRYRSCLTCDKRGQKINKDYIRQAENDLLVHETQERADKEGVNPAALVHGIMSAERFSPVSTGINITGTTNPYTAAYTYTYTTDSPRTEPIYVPHIEEDPDF